jgi:hypothetical protein
MKLLNPSTVMVVLIAMAHRQSTAFTPSTQVCRSQTCHGSHSQVGLVLPSAAAPTFNQRSRRRRIFQKTTELHMAAEDFDESKYTEAAWSLITSLTKVAEFYQASDVEAPFLLELMLNPNVHNAGENAVAAKKVVEKVLNKAGTDVRALRLELETYFSKQPKLSGDTKNKVMGRSLQKVLDAARVGKSTLGVSLL